MTILCGMSAWDYYATPPVVRDVDVPEAIAAMAPPAGAGMGFAYIRGRKNACDAAIRVSSRLVADLKGISLPLELMEDGRRISHRSRLLTPRRYHEDVCGLVPLGNGLYVTSIEQTLLDLARVLSFPQLMMHMLEACGMYALPATTPLTRFVLHGLLEHEPNSLRPQDGCATHFAAYFDEQGKPVSFYGPNGTDAPWELCFDRHHRPTSLWKRAPLTSAERLLTIYERCDAPHADTARKAARFVVDGSASPLESKLVLFMCLDAWHGGEGWCRPSLNRIIPFSKAIQKISGRHHAVGDAVWMDQLVDVEVQGEAFHAGEQGFHDDIARRAGLEAAGFTVFDMTYRHMADMEALELRLKTVGDALDFQLKKRTVPFIKKRVQLHRELFPESWR